MQKRKVVSRKTAFFAGVSLGVILMLFYTVIQKQQNRQEQGKEDIVCVAD